jgi:hypothetical protein
MLVNQGYRHTLRICNTYCFTTEKVVTRMRPQYYFVSTLPVLLAIGWLV